MDIPQKTNRVLQFIALCLMMILVRSWYLGVVQHDYHVEQSKKPQRRVTIEKAERASIHDRFGIPLAVNKIQYNAAVCYANLRQIPGSIWKKNEDGKKVRVAARSEYIASLAEMLSAELGIDATKIEDTIHGKAALLPHTPFVIKEDITEEQYYRLRMMEKDWLGLQAERISRRHYPLGKVACDIIGYLGPIDSMKYLKIAHELNSLEEYLMARERGENPFLPEGFHSPEEVYNRFALLQEKAYTMNDLVGKSGVEAFYEEELRGYFGKHIYEIDVKGNRLQELPGSRKSLPGKKLTLTISAELQGYAEQLLASMEGTQERGTIDENWMRGGAVVAIIPKTGEVVALASYPRFDPNDFIPTRDLDLKKEKELAVHKWLENESYIGSIWEGKRPMEREYYTFVKRKYLEEKVYLTWQRFLHAILPPKLKNIMDHVHDIKTAIQIQENRVYHPLLSELSEDDRLLILDLCHLIAPQELFSPELVKEIGHLSLEQHHQDEQQAMQVLSRIKEDMQELFHENDFTTWRNGEFKEYLKQKRQHEKEQRKYAKPYTDYLDRAEQKLFKAFWLAYKPVFLYTALNGKIPINLKQHPQLYPYFNYLKKLQIESSLRERLVGLSTLIGINYIHTLRAFEDLNSPLQGHYAHIRSDLGKHLEKHLAASFYPLYGYGFARSQAYRQTSAPGSVFKLVTSYQVLLERAQRQLFSNPLTLIDDLKGTHASKSPKQVLGYHLDGSAILRDYKGGRLPRSSHSGIGKIDLIGALEKSSNIYFSILAAEYMENPMNLAKAACAFSYGEKTGIDLPFEAKGNVPDDLDHNLTGLYSFAIGQHTLDVTPLQTAMMLSMIANKGSLIQPHVLKQMEGPQRLLHHEIVSPLSPSMPESMLSTTAEDSEKSILYTPPLTMKRTIPMPPEVFRNLTEGMRSVVMGPRGTARPGVMRNFYDHPAAVRDYFEIHPDLIAKTGTAQVRFKTNISKTAKAVIRDNICFAAIAYPKHQRQIYEDPELVVIVSQKFRGSGREGGPIAAQVVKKWREIQAKYQQ